MGVLALLVAWFFGLATALGASPPTDIEDPRQLTDLGRAALAEGRTDDARELFALALKRHELGQYVNFRPELSEAIVLESLGDVAGAAERYRKAVTVDAMQTVLVLRVLSNHPDRDALAEEAYAYVRAAVEEVKAGGKPVIYMTTKGEPRYLEAMELDDLVALWRKGEKASYCWVEDLDFTKIEGPLPPQINLDRCVIGRMYGPSLVFDKLVFKGIVLGDTDLGKTFEGEKNKSRTLQPAKFADLMFQSSIFLGRANFAAVEVGEEGRAYFPMTVFEGEADFKGAEFLGVTEFRFASFGKDANFRFLRMTQPVYFGGTRYRADTVFSSVYSDRDVYFNSAVFEGNVEFDRCEFQRGATFENAEFRGKASFGTSTVLGNLNLSRAVFRDEVNVKEVVLGELDALGTHFTGDAWFMDAQIRGRARFSLDDVTRQAIQEDIDALLPLYRHYQGDEDADAPLTRTSSYGVRTVDDLNSRIDADISFANTVFGGFTVFERVEFGQPGGATFASFFNSQFLGETHFERTLWHSRADFTTIFGHEVAFNNARFERSLVLDDAAISGRLTLTDASFADGADLSFYGSEIASFQVDPSQVDGVDEPHRLFYERCAYGSFDREDVRIRRLLDGRDLPDDEVRAACYDFAIDEFVALKASYGDRAMTGAEDDAYWWARHHQATRDVWHGDLLTRVKALVIQLFVFELCFGWGVRLGNLAIAAGIVTVTYALLYRLVCPTTMLTYDGQQMPIREVPFLGLCYVSLQVLIAVNTGWDFGDDDHRFRFLNVSETVIGFIMLTFFVGAYTRMILA